MTRKNEMNIFQVLQLSYIILEYIFFANLDVMIFLVHQIKMKLVSSSRVTINIKHLSK